MRYELLVLRLDQERDRKLFGTKRSLVLQNDDLRHPIYRSFTYSNIL
jgi:hypothetical protein